MVKKDDCRVHTEPAAKSWWVRWFTAESGTSILAMFIILVPMLVIAFAFGFDALRYVYVKDKMQDILDAAAQTAVTQTVTQIDGSGKPYITLDTESFSETTIPPDAGAITNAPVWERGSDGEIVTDADGRPIQSVDDEGNLIFEDVTVGGENAEPVTTTFTYGETERVARVFYQSNTRDWRGRIFQNEEPRFRFSVISENTNITPSGSGLGSTDSGLGLYAEDLCTNFSDQTTPKYGVKIVSTEKVPTTFFSIFTTIDEFDLTLESTAYIRGVGC